MIRKVKLGDVCDLSIGFVGTVTTQYEEGGIPFFRTLNVKPYKIIADDLKRITQEFHKSQKKSILRTGDVVMIHTGVPGICCVIPEEYDNSNCIDMIVIKPHKEVVNSDYLVAYMNTIGYKHIEKIQVGCIQKHFNLKDAIDLIIYLPDIEMQNKVGNLVKEINSKIESNNLINAELEEMSKMIYDYWFLQFDFPDKNGKPYKSSGGKMVWNNELKREIPKGWSVGYLSEFAFVTMGSSPKGESLNEEKDGVIFYQGKTDFGYRFPTVRMYTNAPIRYAEVNDILLSVRAPVGDMNIADEKCCIGRGLAAIRCEYQSFLFYLMLANQYQFEKYNSNGTTFGSITKDDLFGLRIIIPDEKTIKEFDSKIKDFDKIIFNNEKENQELVSMRDFLLPLLMNGQLGFKEC